MLADLIRKGYGNKEGLNCSEKILYGANEVYNLGLDKQALKLASGFGGGMGIEDACGAITGSIMVIGCLFADKNNSKENKTRELAKEFFVRYEDQMGYIDCKPLKEEYSIEGKKCEDLIIKAAEMLDDIIERENIK